MSHTDTLPAHSGPGNTAHASRLVVRKDKTNPRRMAYLALLLFATEPAFPLLALGAVMVLAGILLHGWAAGYLARAGYAERESVLTVRGPYRHNRNPYYLAHLVMDLGFFLMAGLPGLYLLYFPVSFSVYRRWVVKEEPFLEKEFGDDYRQFKAEVPRWGFRLFPAPARGREQKFEWAMFRLNRETHRTLPHLLLWTVLLGYAFLGNPLAQFEPLVLVTLFAAFAVRLITFDIQPTGAVGVSPAWMIAAGVTAVLGGAFLVTAPVWTPWPQALSIWLGALGLSMGLVIGISLLPGERPILGGRLQRSCARPECQWYLIGLGLGLLSGTLGGIWVGILLPLVLWMFNAAGMAPVWHLPRQGGAAIAVLGLFGISAAAAVVRLAA